MNNPTVSPEPSLTPPRDTESAADERAREDWQMWSKAFAGQLETAARAMQMAAHQENVKCFAKSVAIANTLMCQLENLERGWRQDER